MKKIKDYSKKELTMALALKCQAFGIEEPSEMVYDQIIDFLLQNHSQMQPDIITKAFNYWASAETKIGRPRVLNSYFLGQVIRVYTDYFRGTKPGGHLKSSHYEKPLNLSEKEKQENAVNVIKMAYESYLLMHQGDRCNMYHKLMEIADSSLNKFGAYKDLDFNQKAVKELAARLDANIKIQVTESEGFAQRLHKIDPQNHNLEMLGRVGFYFEYLRKLQIKLTQVEQKILNR